MSTNGARSVLKIANRRFFERENYELRNYELWRGLRKSLTIRLVRHAPSRLGAAFARAVSAARRSRKAGAPSGRPIVSATCSAAIAPGAARQRRRNLDQPVVAPGYYDDVACFRRGPRRSPQLCLSEIQNLC
jgi:hypothetical protein